MPHTTVNASGNCFVCGLPHQRSLSYFQIAGPVKQDLHTKSTAKKKAEAVASARSPNL